MYGSSASFKNSENGHRSAPSPHVFMLAPGSTDRLDTASQVPQDDEGRLETAEDEV